MLTHPSCSILVGKPESGKSSLLKYLLYELGLSCDIHLLILFSRTSRTQQYDYIPDVRQYPAINMRLIKNIMINQKAIAQKNGGKMPNIVLVFDDGIDKKTFTQDFMNLINSHRHYNISVIFSIQYLLGNISTNFREVANHCYVFKVSTEVAIKGNYSAFFQGCGISLGDYTKMNAELNDHEFWYINKRSGTFKKMIGPNPKDLPNFRFKYIEKVVI